MNKPATLKRKTPSKKELERKFVMRLDRSGKPFMKENEYSGTIGKIHSNVQTKAIGVFRKRVFNGTVK